jgi:transcriptional regulator of acetoin/glycerol metabolism
VRELENALERAAVVADDRRILPQNLPAGVREAASPNLGIGPARGKSLADMERSHIMAVLREAGGNRTHAAEILGIGGTTLWRKLKSWGYAD